MSLSLKGSYTNVLAAKSVLDTIIAQGTPKEKIIVFCSKEQAAEFEDQSLRFETDFSSLEEEQTSWWDKIKEFFGADTPEDDLEALKPYYNELAQGRILLAVEDGGLIEEVTDNRQVGAMPESSTETDLASDASPMSDLKNQGSPANTIIGQPGSLNENPLGNIPPVTPGMPGEIPSEPTDGMLNPNRTNPIQNAADLDNPDLIQDEVNPKNPFSNQQDTLDKDRLHDENRDHPVKDAVSDVKEGAKNIAKKGANALNDNDDPGKNNLGTDVSGDSHFGIKSEPSTMVEPQRGPMSNLQNQGSHPDPVVSDSGSMSEIPDNMLDSDRENPIPNPIDPENPGVIQDAVDTPDNKDIPLQRNGLVDEDFSHENPEIMNDPSLRDRDYAADVKKAEEARKKL
ncbi:general stress protein [Enterococcus timonensis]|uniref:general stress protein n=1 Tax=Enterococcus timonensis TaxID=1852364 RepID=UPI0008DABA3B|nr:general stress protein [Enterococcus timonensis]